MTPSTDTRVLRGGSWRARGRTPILAGVNDGFVLGVTKPTAEHVGPRVAHDAVVTGDVILSTPGEVFERKLVLGTISVRAANVTIRDVTVRMPASTSTGRVGIAFSRAGSAGLVEFTSVEVPAANRSYHNAYSVQGSGFTIRRCDFSGTTDGISIAGVHQRAGAVVESTRIHDLPHFDYDGVHADGTHNDCIQVEGNLTYVIIDGCWLTKPYTAAILITQDFGTYDSCPVVRRTWFDIDASGAGDGAIVNVKYDTDKAEPRILPALPTGNRLTIESLYFTRDYPSRARILIYPQQLAVTVISSHGPTRSTYTDGAYPVPLFTGTSPQLTTYGQNP